MPPDESPPESIDEATRRLDDALERVAHGAAVSMPSILLQRGLTVAFTAALTNVRRRAVRPVRARSVHPALPLADRAARLYHVTSRLVLVGVVAAVPVVVYRETVMAAFGPTFTQYAPLLVLFVLAQTAACAAGSVGILLRMTDHQRALLVTNVAITTVLAVVAIPLTVELGLAGVVWAYVLMLTLNNGVEVAVLYRLEGLQPFTRRHGFPLLAAVPFAAVAFAVRAVAPGVVAAVVGTLLGLAVFAATLEALGFTPVERRLASTLLERYGKLLR